MNCILLVKTNFFTFFLNLLPTFQSFRKLPYHEGDVFLELKKGARKRRVRLLKCLYPLSRTRAAQVSP